MSKLLFVDRAEENGKRIFHFLQFSKDESNFIVRSYFRQGDDVKQREASIPEFLSASADTDQEALLNAIGIILGMEILPSMHILD